MANANGVGRMNNAKANSGSPIGVFNTQPTIKITKTINFPGIFKIVSNF